MLREISFRNEEPTPAIRALVERRVEALAKFHPRLLRCRVMIESPHHHRREGRLHHVRIDLHVPGAELVVGRDPARKKEHADLEVAIRDAFHAARRVLMDDARMARRQVKEHAGPKVGRVTKLLRSGFGFLETDDGRAIYFHRNSALDGFDRLAVGTRVRFTEEAGADGPQASTITIAGRHVRARPGARP